MQRGNPYDKVKYIERSVKVRRFMDKIKSILKKKKSSQNKSES